MTAGGRAGAAVERGRENGPCACAGAPWTAATARGADKTRSKFGFGGEPTCADLGMGNLGTPATLTPARPRRTVACATDDRSEPT